MAQNDPQSPRRPGLAHEPADVGSYARTNIRDCRQGDDTLRSRHLARNQGVPGAVSRTRARGPPVLRAALGRCGPSAQLSQFASAAMTVMFTDATSLQLARQPAQHGSSRPLATADDHESVSPGSLHAASKRSQRLPSRSTSAAPVNRRHAGPLTVVTTR